MWATECASGTYLSNGKCVACGTGIKTCTSTAASVCLDGYYGATVNSVYTCTVCTTGAKTCTEAKVHSTCNEGYAIISPSTTC